MTFMLYVVLVVLVSRIYHREGWRAGYRAANPTTARQEP
jgi:hypothetical protein